MPEITLDNALLTVLGALIVVVLVWLIWAVRRDLKNMERARMERIFNPKDDEAANDLENHA